jgi:hypothetical protein
MAQLKVEKLKEDLVKQGFNADQVEKIGDTVVANIKPGTYDKAVWFIGLATLVLIVGFIVLAVWDKSVPGELWTVLGASIGGLAGIFTGNK